MSTIDIHLPEALKSYLEEEAARRGYKTPSEFVAAVLEAEQFRNFRDELEASLVEALEEPSSPLTEKDCEDIRREGTAIIEKRRQK